MKTYILFICFIISSISVFSQIDTLAGYYPNGQLGRKFPISPINYAHPLYAINANTAGFDSAAYYISTFASNATSDSVILTFLNGRRLAAKAAGAGGGGSAAGSIYQVQYNGESGAFAASPLFTYTPSSTASSNLARGLYIGNTALTSSAIGDYLVGVDIDNPAFSNGSGFASVKQYALRVGGAINLSGTYTPTTTYTTQASGLYANRRLSGPGVDGASFNDTLVATANNAVLRGVTIQPIFVNGSFTGTTNTSLAVTTGTTAVQALTATTILATNTIQGNNTITAGSSYPRVRLFEFGFPATEYSSSNGTTMVGQASANDEGITGLLKNDFYVSLRYTGSTFNVGSGTGTKFKVFKTTGSAIIQNEGTFTEDTSAMLQVNGLYKGILLPRASYIAKETSNTGIALFGGATGGTGYTPGTYTNITLTGGSGTGAIGTIVVTAGGAASINSLSNAGYHYKVGDVLSATGFGAGSGFSVPISALKYTAKGLVMTDTSSGQIAMSNGVNFTGGVVTSSASTLTLYHGTDYIFNGSTATYTLPPINSSISGRQNEIHIVNEGSGSITLNSDTGSTLYTSSLTSSITIAAGATAILFPTGSNFKVKLNQ